jgi:hypothetical protein
MGNLRNWSRLKAYNTVRKAAGKQDRLFTYNVTKKGVRAVETQ